MRAAILLVDTVRRLGKPVFEQIPPLRYDWLLFDTMDFLIGGMFPSPQNQPILKQEAGFKKDGDLKACVRAKRPQHKSIKDGFPVRR